MAGDPISEHDADADADLPLMLAEIERCREGGDQAFRHRDGTRAIRPGLDDDEFVAAEPRHSVLGPNRGPQAVGDSLEETITDRVTEGVVDRLEAIEIEAV